MLKQETIPNNLEEPLSNNPNSHSTASHPKALNKADRSAGPRAREPEERKFRSENRSWVDNSSGPSACTHDSSSWTWHKSPNQKPTSANPSPRALAAKSPALAKAEVAFSPGEKNPNTRGTFVRHFRTCPAHCFPIDSSSESTALTGVLHARFQEPDPPSGLPGPWHPSCEQREKEREIHIDRDGAADGQTEANSVQEPWAFSVLQFMAVITRLPIFMHIFSRRTGKEPGGKSILPTSFERNVSFIRRDVGYLGSGWWCSRGWMFFGLLRVSMKKLRLFCVWCLDYCGEELGVDCFNLQQHLSPKSKLDLPPLKSLQPPPTLLTKVTAPISLLPQPSPASIAKANPAFPPQPPSTISKVPPRPSTKPGAPPGESSSIRDILGP
ncbi:hypothetical protein KM043_001193 [Ampulex compressa]|nr:hypothetical protein KM043_001193 [Ampulex compressa]